MYNEGFVSSDGPTQDRDLAGDAVWLAGVVATSLPEGGRGVGAGRAAHFQHARATARFADHGALVLLPDQDRSHWDHDASAPARRCSSGGRPARRRGRPAAGRDRGLPRHSPRGRRPTGSRSSRSSTCWRGYDPSPVVRLNRAVAVSRLGPEHVSRALAEVDALADRLDGYHLFHATRAELLPASAATTRPTPPTPGPWG